jgi:hypothetical protein
MRRNGASNIDQAMMDKIIVRNGLRTLDMAKYIFAGDCPFCGHKKSFILWQDKGTYRCYWCGCDGRFVRTPERELEERNLLKAKLEANEEQNGRTES